MKVNPLSSFKGNAPSIVSEPAQNSPQQFEQEHPMLYATVPTNFFKSTLLSQKTYMPLKINPRVFPERYVMNYANYQFLSKALKENPEIAKKLSAEGLTQKIEPQNVTTIIHSHLIPTMIYAKDIMTESREAFSSTDYIDMAQAALLHDIGKALIPQEILNKKGKLTPKEYEIIKLHNDLGYEILKTSDVNKRVLDLVLNHHGYGSVYPKNTLSQILTVADIYSALKENRAYKSPMTDEQAFSILEQGAKAGDYNIHYVDALKASLKRNKRAPA